MKEQLAASQQTVNALQSEIDITTNALQSNNAIQSATERCEALHNDFPEPAILLNQLKGKHPKSKASSKDIEVILEMLGG